MERILRALGVAGIVVLSAAGVRADPQSGSILFDCASGTCQPLSNQPRTGTWTLVFLNAREPPTVEASGRALAVERCTNDKQSYCVYSVPVGGLKIAGHWNASVGGPDLDKPSPMLDEPDVDTFADVVLVGGAKGYFCSGVLLDSRHVLTAGHCLPATEVGFGPRAENAVSVGVTKTILHPDADAAVLELTSYVNIPAHQWHLPTDGPPLGTVRVIGYGVRDPLHFGSFGERHFIDTQVDGWGCTVSRAALLGCRPATELLIHDDRGNDTCFGDSGGPVFEKTEFGWRLLAITSRGTHPVRVLCGEGGIYVRVDVIDRWVRKVVGK